MISPIAFLGLAAGAVLVVLYLLIGRQRATFEILVDAPPKIVWEQWVVACGNNGWRPLIEIELVERVSESPLTIRVKATPKGLGGMPMEQVWRYDVYEPYRRYQCRVVSGGRSAEESGELTESGNGTRLAFTITARASGVAGAWFARQRTERTLRALKTVCEALAKPGT